MYTEFFHARGQTTSWIAVLAAAADASSSSTATGVVASWIAVNDDVTGGYLWIRIVRSPIESRRLLSDLLADRSEPLLRGSRDEGWNRPRRRRRRCRRRRRPIRHR